MGDHRGPDNRDHLPGGGLRDRGAAAPARHLTPVWRPPWWAATWIIALALILAAGIAVNGAITVHLLNAQRRQRADFCHAEHELRAKITEIEVKIKSYVYVPPAPQCRP